MSWLDITLGTLCALLSAMLWVFLLFDPGMALICGVMSLSILCVLLLARVKQLKEEIEAFKEKHNAGRQE